ncbi:MAG: hypothetical protein SD837_15310 [Candidatus Electrothrix scaldis]|nr:MAG: hypothetical protein SD837_15310 [Candidatus Electrothrix sp. GW3-3]
MNKILRTTVYSLIGAALLLPRSTGLAADVCGEGIGIPPFLSSGARPNLLMVLDNSGSMLDAAYSKSGNIYQVNSDGDSVPITVGNGNSQKEIQYQSCMDGDYEITSGGEVLATVVGYDKGTNYAGYFKRAKWYKWEDGEYPSWQSGDEYHVGDRVSVYGNIYKAIGLKTEQGPSVGESIEKDTVMEWDRIFSKNQWSSKVSYPVGEYAWVGSRLYKAKVANTGLDPEQDDGTNWELKQSTWESGTSYAAEAIVTYNGIYYEALDGNTGKRPDEYSTTDSPVWRSLRQGAFKEINDDQACPDAEGTEYARSGAVCLSINETVTPHKVTSFTAHGNFLNWAMASKFDVEKNILTGGKYNYYEGVLVSEHRGCSAGDQLIKQVKLDNSDGYLSLAVRGSNHDETDPFMNDRVDTVDDTARLEILGITAEGLKSTAECQIAVDALIAVTTGSSCSANSAKTEINACLTSVRSGDISEDLLQQQSVMAGSLELCGKIWHEGCPDPNLTDDIGACAKLYTGQGYDVPHPPSTIEPAYGAYFCYGLYNEDVDQDDRVGYMGRCWKPAQGQFKTCEAKPAVSAAEGGCDGDPCRYNTTKPTRYYKNEDGYNYKCGANKEDNCELTDMDWDLQFAWSNGSGDCDTEGATESIGDGGSPAAWDDVDGECTYQAARDYCQDNLAEEVIDPSEQDGRTSDNWNIPGVLADSGVLIQFGGKAPLATMKGYIVEDTRPEGIIQSVADDLRLGLMAFNYVGAATECGADFQIEGIKRFCPAEGKNRDGAVLLSEIEDGDWVKALDSSYDNGKRRHVDELAQNINDTRATSWTPLGEALYSALGYYTQNSMFCLNVDGSGNCLDWCLDVDDDPDSEYYDVDPETCAYPADDDPVQYWCQDNHILVITEGESTADLNDSVTKFIAAPDSYFGPDATSDEKSWVGDDDTDGDTDNYSGCTDGLYGGTYLDDMTWWGQNSLPLYKKRYLSDPDGNQNEKNPISTYMVTTGTLTGDTSDECNPDTLMTNAAVNGGTEYYYSGEDPQQLEDNLYAVLGDIMTRASAGAAASVISNSRSGDGAIYQALFWPRKENGIEVDGVEGTISWAGNIHALFIDSNNILYEDTNQNGKLDPDAAGTPDKEIHIYFSNTVSRARGCYVDLVDDQCPTDPATDCVVGSDCAELEDIRYLWSANDQLRKMKDEDLDGLPDRKIFTWNDLDNDGIVNDDEDSSLNDTGETFLLKHRTDWASLISDEDQKLYNRGSLVNDFLTDADYSDFAGPSDTQVNDAMNALVTWLMGVDQLNYESTDDNNNSWLDRPLRSRQYRFVTKDDDGTITSTEDTEWRLGDVIHSSPITVNKPAENFHLIYRDPTYKDYVRRWTDRRTVVYFGANDGMLHAVNSGFYKDTDRQFYCSKGYTGQADHGDCGDGEYNLGEEMWAYIPYNLQPHLKCLAGKFYDHKYFVDLEPRIADVQIFKPETACATDVTSDDCIHAGGWGTILIGGMRFGGAAIDAENLNGLDGSGADGIHDTREFSSSYFILDITDPENPRVLGELTRTTDGTCAGDDACVDLNYTTSSPTIVSMRQDDGGSKWYLVMGNGPAELDGTNNAGTQGKVAVLPLEWLNGTISSWTEGVPNAITSETKKAIRIPDTLPSTATYDGGVFNVPFPDGDQTSGSYISHIISMDYNIDLTAGDGLGARYRTDAVYFGTVDGTDFGKYSDSEIQTIYPKATDIYTLGDQWYWNGGGRVFRLVTRQNDTLGDEIASTPASWTTPPGLPDSVKGESEGPIRMLMDVKGPVTSGPSAGYDEEGKNFWIYVGTGRFYDEKDKTDDGRCIYADCESFGNDVDCGAADGCTWNTDDLKCIPEDSCSNRTQKAFFGLKEPVKDGRDLQAASDVCSDSVMTWATIEWDITDWGTATNGKTEANSETGMNPLVPGGPLPSGGVPGQRGLMRTDNILVGADTGYLYCGHFVTLDEDTYYEPWWAADSDDVLNEICFPDGKNGPIYDTTLEEYTFEKLQQYITGTGCQTASDDREYTTGLDGWYHVFHDPRERNLNSSLLFNSKLFFSTYQPYNDKCKAEGQSFLYKLSHTTGTGAWDILVDPDDGSKGSGESTFGASGSGFGGGSSSTGSSENPGEVHEFKSPVRGLANVGSAGAAGSGGEFYAEKPEPAKRESNKLNWSDKCGVEE